MAGPKGGLERWTSWKDSRMAETDLQMLKTISFGSDSVPSLQPGPRGRAEGENEPERKRGSTPD